VIGFDAAPGDLHRAREALRAGDLPAAAFKRVEDRAVDQMIAMQEGAGVDVVTDGEMRRRAPAAHVKPRLSPLLTRAGRDGGAVRVLNICARSRSVQPECGDECRTGAGAPDRSS
jgi:methionine synthase II (cobalamin-independent)